MMHTPVHWTCLRHGNTTPVGAQSTRTPKTKMSPNFLGVIAGWLKTLEEMQRQRILLTDAELQKNTDLQQQPSHSKNLNKRTHA